MEIGSQDIARALLEWYRAAGVTDAVGEAPVDWLARGDEAPARLQPAAKAPAPRASPSAEPPATNTPRVAPPPTLPPAARQFTATPPDEAVMAARAQAAEARTLADLEQILQRFEGCPLKATAKNLCFYRGAEKARVMAIGEAPGRDEDIEGKPFVGRSGQLLDRMLGAIGLGEADVHVTNVVYWRPPGNRTPTPQETLMCRPFLERQVELVAPEILLLLGGAAAKQILAVEDGIMRLRGRWRDVEIAGRSYKALATLHPAYLLRTPAQKRLAWRDLLMVAQELG